MKIKALKKSLRVDDLNMYMAKKLLWKPEVRLMHYESVFQREFYVALMMLPELRRQFGQRKNDSCVSNDVTTVFWTRVLPKKTVTRFKDISLLSDRTDPFPTREL